MESTQLIVRQFTIEAVVGNRKKRKLSDGEPSLLVQTLSSYKPMTAEQMRLEPRHMARKCSCRGTHGADKPEV